MKVLKLYIKNYQSRDIAYLNREEFTDEWSRNEAFYQHLKQSYRKYTV
jgi:hypothetical protein